MVQTFTGSNGFLLQHDLSKLVNEFLMQHGDLALERIDGEEVSLAQIQEAITSLPFLSDKKMVVLRAPGANKQFVEGAEKLLTLISDTTDVVIIEPKVDKRSLYYKFLKKQTEFHEYGELDSNGLAAWLVRTAKNDGGTLSSNDARYLIERVGSNQQMLANEIEKLLLHNSEITRASIDLLTEQTPQSTIFQLIEAAFSGNTKKALHLYEEQRALKNEAPQIIAMLTWQLHILVIIKLAGNRSGAEIAGEAKLSPYVVQKSMAIAHRIDLNSLKKRINDLLDIDAKSKRTNLDIDDALQFFLLQLAEKN